MSIQQVSVHQTKNYRRSFKQVVTLALWSRSSGDLRKEPLGNGYYLYGKVIFLKILIIYFYWNVSKEDSDRMKIILLKKQRPPGPGVCPGGAVRPGQVVRPRPQRGRRPGQIF